MKKDTSLQVNFQDVERASKIVREVVNRTPFEISSSYSKRFDCTVYLKMENLQRTGSFKMRGSYNKIYNLSAEQKKKGVIAASAGNHAQGVALSAALNGIRSVVVMPQYASLAKVAATKSYGAEVVLYGSSFDEAFNRSLQIQKERDMTFIHGYNDPMVIAGQGTLGIEIAEENAELDYLIVPVGGGGLISGIAVAMRELSPGTKIIGVQAAAMPAFAESLKRGKIVECPGGETIADGIAIGHPGEIAFRIVSRLVEGIFTVTEDEITEAVFLLLERSKLLVEGAGASPLALLLSGKLDVRGKKVGLVLSGGNVDLSLVRKIILRGLMMHRRIAVVEFNTPDRPGAMKDTLSLIAEGGASVMSLQESPGNSTEALNRFYARVVIEVEDSQHLDKLAESFRKSGLNFRIVD
ncbi:MAG: threonine ammonia-lyase [Thermoplasmata archaeon]|uniref:threonine ammonia-lyase n=1 Tax=Candidatus Sysuiplasma superficiale TaxID=2823368 RepID=A0A8J7YWS7_9ARCH|nr:threonine ammonia-lyase [Candidatus Sysuiplasma superficiale]MBX8644284.1 threonine ammonia-lyase [Candidatus Sysuiplasma superficiale]